MTVKYINSNNEEINLISFRTRIKDAIFHSYSWGYEGVTQQFGTKISNFTKEPIEYDATIVFRGSIAQRKESLDNFLRTAEIDVINKTPGKLIAGGSYINGYVISSSTQPYDGADWTQKDVVFLCPYPFWITEHPYYFKASEILSTNNKRYPGRYAYRYANGLTNASITNEHYAECNFRLIIYGPCNNPAIYVGGYGYLFKIVLEEGEYLEVDSAAETVTKYMTSGIKVNAFNNRNFANSVFRPIQTGRQEVNWNGRFDFDLVLLEERSEPKWS